MALQCPNCDSRFFKTLETRATSHALFYKKRCKRCKHKYLYRQDPLDGQMSPASYESWCTAYPLSKEVTRGQVFASEFTRRIRSAAENNTHYLNQIAKATAPSQENPSYGSA